GTAIGRVSQVLRRAVVLDGLSDLDAVRRQVRPALNDEVGVARYLGRRALAEGGDLHANPCGRREVRALEVPEPAGVGGVAHGSRRARVTIDDFDTNAVSRARHPANLDRLSGLEALPFRVCLDAEAQDLG